MWPAVCPATANAAERAVFAAVERWLGGDWAGWFQVAVPGRDPAPHPGAPRRAPVPLRADFILLGPTGLYVIEIKGWRAASVVDADDSTVTFRNGARAQHPLVQAYRYAAGLASLLRAQPGVLAGAVIPVRYAAALPYVRVADLAGRPWAPVLSGLRLLLAADCGPALPDRLAALPPPGALLPAAQQAAVARLFTRPEVPPPPGAPRLFD
jgi:nuclease-like protein